MTKLNQVYKCNVCGNIAEMLHTGAGELVCCGQPMQLREENTEDAAQEKHAPVIEKSDNGFIAKVGSVPHPMEEAHYIKWIEVIIDGRICRKFLKPGDEPQAEFCLKGDNIQARAYCNLHGLWSSK